MANNAVNSTNVPISSNSNDKRIQIPEKYFIYTGSSETAGNSLYKCLNCPFGFTKKKPLSCSDSSRQNLKKHIEVRYLVIVTIV
jgi:hypothetical protein